MVEVVSLKIGDRVRLRPETVDLWLQPYRKFAVEGRTATVTDIPNSESSFYRIEFDVRRKGVVKRWTSVSLRDVVKEPEHAG